MREQLIELALKVLEAEGKEIEFKELWNKVVELSGMDLEGAIEFISDFYSDLSLDNRFVGVEKTKWDLRARRKFEETMIVTEEIEEDEEEIEEDEEEKVETK